MTIAILIIGGLALLFLGGEWLVKGSVALAKSFSVPNIVIGLTIVALGTSAPEFIVSINAALTGHPEIALGNIIGSNISNILLVLSVSALIYPITVGDTLTRYDSITLALGAVLLFIFCQDGNLGAYEGFGMLFCLFMYNFTLYKIAKKSRSKLPKHKVEEAEELIKGKISNKAASGFVLIGIASLAIGAEMLVNGSVSLAKLMGLSEAVIGLTLVAIGSSAPELATSVVAARHRHSDVAIGNIIGSNIMNILAGIGIAAGITNITVDQKFIEYDLFVLLAVTFGFIVAVLFYKKIDRALAGLFFIGYIAYIFSQF